MPLVAGDKLGPYEILRYYLGITVTVNWRTKGGDIGFGERDASMHRCIGFQPPLRV
jgi:hypothetical protein